MEQTKYEQTAHGQTAYEQEKIALTPIGQTDNRYRRLGKEKSVVTPVAKTGEENDRRAGRRVKLSRLTLIAPDGSRFKPEILSTANSSRDGLYFVTAEKYYFVGMRLNVTSGYVPNDPCNSASLGEVVRVEPQKDGKWGVAVRILMR